jgi:hypothetical protein
MDHNQALTALHAGELVEAAVKPSASANGWLLVFVTRDGEQIPYSGHTGTEPDDAYRTLEYTLIAVAVANISAMPIICDPARVSFKSVTPNRDAVTGSTIATIEATAGAVWLMPTI